MMYRYFNQGYYGNGNCFGFFNNGYGMFITLGLIITILLVLYFLGHTKKRKTSYDAALENLKMKYVKGEITEEEFVRRKDIMNR